MTELSDLQTSGRLAERNAIYSSCCGFLGEALLTDSAIIILFAGMLGAGDMFTMFTTSVLPFFNGLFVIPMAWMSTRIGYKRLNLTSCILAAIAYFTAVSAPLWQPMSVGVLMVSIVMFAFFLTGFIASWFPLVNSFLESGRRATFFGRMRFRHQTTAVIFLFLTGLIIGENPPLWKLQIVLLCGAFIFCGRSYFVSRLPAGRVSHESSINFRHGLIKALQNKPLMSFSVYLFMLSVGAFGTVPVTLLSLKRQGDVPENVIVILSSVALAGMLLGYVSASRIIRRLNMRGSILLINISFILINLTLAIFNISGLSGLLACGVLLAMDGFMIATLSIIASTEMLALASKANKTLSMAVCSALSLGGAGCSRLTSSLLLGSGLIADNSQLFSLNTSRYQFMFFIYALATLVSVLFLPLVTSLAAKINNPQNTA